MVLEFDDARMCSQQSPYVKYTQLFKDVERKASVHTRRIILNQVISLVETGVVWSGSYHGSLFMG